MQPEQFVPTTLDKIDLDPGIFRAYDIRGITRSNLTDDVCYWIGRAFAAEARSQNQQAAAIGRDGRLSSPGIALALGQGLVDGGMSVTDIGQVPTPVLYYATHALKTGTGIMITGSHNPPEYNGLKMMIGGTTLAEDLIQVLYRRLQDSTLSTGKGALGYADLGADYVEAALNTTKLDRPLKVAVDCGNGVAGELGPKLISALGCEVIPLFCEIDGNFPNHHPDPAEPENLQDLITAVQQQSADVGLAFDGDGDRLGVVTPKGEIIWPDKMMMLFAQDIIARNPQTPVIFDVKCSTHLERVITEAGGNPIMWKTGHSHIKAKIKQTQAALAGEFSGHICFGERWYGFDDALYTAARLLELLSQTELDVDAVFAQYPTTYSTPEIKIHTTETRKFEVMDELASSGDFADGRMTTIDGIRVDFDDRWGLIRPSNTSPVLSLRFEADSAAALERVQDEFQTQLSNVDATLTFR
ncbi:MAG: phosphomannomutase/phosphoglucomutase [Pseudomonadota bacterium]|nr:phosphomannomutase/phosphoglucomutase [Pseudomonadota bacterium]MEC7780765.1 phosphomannomutase/phosphoglucomutase [Pseudomonadota bacterium]MED5341959.1 phosphomannomutase/phosphoglucomutase [Pseudomonadota bacterium]